MSLWQAWQGQNLAIRVISILVLGFLVWESIEYYTGLYSQYGANTEDRSYITNPKDIGAAFIKTLELCQQDQTKEGIDCNQSVKGLERLISAYDLQSQRSMARSALGLLHLNFWQLFFGLLTLFAIGWTLLETRRTADAAIDTAKAAKKAERAYISFSSFQNPVKTSSEMVISLTYENFGKTPATNLTISAGYEVIEGGFKQGSKPKITINTHHETNTNGEFLPAERTMTTDVLVSGDDIYNRMARAECQIVFAIKIRYRTMFGDWKVIYDKRRLHARDVVTDGSGKKIAEPRMSIAKADTREDDSESPEFVVGA